MKPIAHFLAFACLMLSVKAVDAQDQRIICGTPLVSNVKSATSVQSLAATGSQGAPWYIPATGTIRALAVYVQFSDDTTSDEYWPSGQLPSNYSNILDQSTLQSYRQNSLSDFYRVMSRGNTTSGMNLIGDVYPNLVRPPNTMSNYISAQKDFGDVNRDVLASIDASVNFASYDNCSGNIGNSPNGVVDMVFIIYRYIPLALKAGYGNWNGISGLGVGYQTSYSTNDYNSKGQQVIIRFGVGQSGVTVDTKSRTFNLFVAAHEFAHYLFGFVHFGPTGGCNLMNDDPCYQIGGMDAYERFQLGYITPTTVSADQSVTLGDFYSTGNAVKLAIPGQTNEYYFVENRSVTNIYDQSPTRGVYIFHINGDGMDNIEVATPNGFWDYALDASGKIYKAAPDAVSGASWLEKIRVGNTVYQYPYAVNSIGRDFVNGNVEDAFNLGYAQVFSPWTNPSSNRFTTFDESNGLYQRDLNTSLAAVLNYYSGNSAILNFYVGGLTSVSGSITTSTTWSKFVNVSGTVTVSSGVTLTISAGTYVAFEKRASLVVNGTLVANSTVTIPVGASMIVNPGATVKFAPGVSLYAYGVLNAVGTASQWVTLTSTGGTYAGAWGAIVLNGSAASGSTLGYVTMQYGTNVQAINTSNITIRNSRFLDNNGAIDFENSTGLVQLNKISYSADFHGIIVANGSNVNCIQDTLTKTSGRFSDCAIYYGGGASGKIANNDIDYFNWGICAIWSSSPTSNWPYYYGRNNRVTHCSYGLMVYRYSYPNFGTPQPSDYMWNSIHDNNYNVQVGSYIYPGLPSTLVAFSNWWGASPPDASKFRVLPGTNFYYTPYLLPPDPWNGVPLPSIQAQNALNYPIMASVASAGALGQGESAEGADAPTPSPDPLYNGIRLRDSGRFKDAKDFFESYLGKNPDDQRAYVELYDCFNDETAQDITSFFKSLPGRAHKDHKLLLGYLHLRQGNERAARVVNNSIIAENPNTSLAVRAFMNNFFMTLHNENDPDSAASMLASLSRKSNLTTQLELSTAEQALKTYVDPKTGTMPYAGYRLPADRSSQGTLGRSSLANGQVVNYPNPFNPATTITYNLPSSGKVKLIVYDVIGRHVMTLVDEYQTLGIHAASFDGSGLASGVYFYRLTAPGVTQVKKMLLTK